MRSDPHFYKLAIDCRGLIRFLKRVRRLSSRVADHVRRLGFLIPKIRKAVCLLGNVDELRTIYPLVDAALRQRPAYRLIIATPLAMIDETRARYPHEIVVPLPPLNSYDRWCRNFTAELVLLSPDFASYGNSPVRSLLCNDRLSPQRIVDRLPEMGSSFEDMGVHPVLSKLVRLMAGKPIESAEELSQRLRSPKIILCLGNGPSSEDPRLRQVTYDTLFRVNWIWRDRRLFVSPDVVITADPDLPPAGRRPILGFPDKAAGLSVLARHCLLFRQPRRGYAFLDGFLAGLTKQALAPRPSNGAVMIALAASLNPERIVIAGLDLYEHVAGRYPGDSTAIDGYSRDHDRRHDVDLIRMSLAAYEGETVIYSDGLREALASSGFHSRKPTQI
jgi:hypothetical protein